MTRIVTPFGAICHTGEQSTGAHIVTLDVLRIDALRSIRRGIACSVRNNVSCHDAKVLPYMVGHMPRVRVRVRSDTLTVDVNRLTVFHSATVSF